MSTIEIGQRYKLTDPNNAHDGIVLTVARIERDKIVRFSDAPYAGFFAGIAYFMAHYERVS